MSPSKRLAAVRLAVQRKYRRKLTLKRKKTIARPSTIPPVDFHEYVTSGNSTEILNRKLEECEAILPGSATAYLKSHELLKEVETLRCAQFCISNVKDNDIFQFWTGMPSYGVFSALLTYLRPRAESMQYWKGSSKSSNQHYNLHFASKPGRQRKLSLEDELFLTLVRLRTGLLMVDLAACFSISIASASSVFTTWINLLYVELKDLCCLPNIDSMLVNRAKSFDDFRDVHMVMDCT